MISKFKGLIESSIFIALIFLLGLFWMLYTSRYDEAENQKVFPATSDDTLNRILASINNDHRINLNTEWLKYECSVPKEESLVNIIHIKKFNGNYKVECEFGPSYDLINYEPLNHNYSLYSGWIRNSKCDEQVANDIEIGIKMPQKCIVPLFDIDNTPDEYYFLYIACKSINGSDSKFIDSILQKQCVYNIKNKESYYTGFRLIVDKLKGFYWVGIL